MKNILDLIRSFGAARITLSRSPSDEISIYTDIKLNKDQTSIIHNHIQELAGPQSVSFYEMSQDEIKENPLPLR